MVLYNYCDKIKLNLFNKILCFLIVLSLVFCSKKKSFSYENKHASVFFDSSYSDDLGIKEKKKYLDSIDNLIGYVNVNDTITRNLHLKLALEYYYLNDLKKSLELSVKALKMSKEAKDTMRVPTALFYIGDCLRTEQKDSAYYYYLQAEKLYFKNNDYDNTAKMLFYKGYVLFYDGNYVECEVEISKALGFLSNSKNYRLIYSCNTLMGNCLEKLNDYDEALRYHQIAKSYLDLMRESNIDKDEINNYNISSVINICNLYDLKGEYSKSIIALQRVLTEELRKKWPRLYANVLSNLAFSKMKNKEYRNVQSMFLKSLSIVDSLGNKSDILYKKIYLGEFFLTQKDTIKSVNTLKEAYDLSKEIKNNDEALASLKILSAIDKKDRLMYAYSYIELSDSLTMVEKKAHNKYARIEYETSVIMDENEFLSKSNFYIVVLSVSIIIIMIFFYLLRYLKFKNRELSFLRKQQMADEEIYNLLTQEHKKIALAKEEEKAEIAKELHDGVMNRIYGVRMNLGFFNSHSDEKIIQKRKEYIYELQNIEKEIRAISHDLSKSSFFDDKDFNFLLLSLIQNQQNFSTTIFDYVIDSSIDWSSIQNIFKVNLYRIIQEAIFNINKYANAEHCSVVIRIASNDLLELEISDDGEGFDLMQDKKGIGLQNLKERVSTLNGNFNIESKKGMGTKINVTFNYHKQDQMVVFH